MYSSGTLGGFSDVASVFGVGWERKSMTASGRPERIEATVSAVLVMLVSLSHFAGAATQRPRRKRPEQRSRHCVGGHCVEVRGSECVCLGVSSVSVFALWLVLCLVLVPPGSFLVHPHLALLHPSRQRMLLSPLSSCASNFCCLLLAAATVTANAHCPSHRPLSRRGCYVDIDHSAPSHLFIAQLISVLP